MRFGLFGGATAKTKDGPDVDTAQSYYDFIEYVIEAEALGYHSTFTAEHHFTGYGQISATLNLLTWLGAKTSTIRLGTAVLVLPWHNPVLVAEQVATIDVLTGGRVDLGIGKGYRSVEFKSFCVPQEEAGARFTEALDLMRKSWISKERFSYHGKYWHFDDIIVEPPVQQQPHPPLWMAAGTEPSIREAARNDCCLLVDQFCSLDTVGERLGWYRDEVQKLGRKFDPKTVGIARAFFVAHNEQEKETALDNRIAAQQKLVTVSGNSPSDRKASILTFEDTRESSEEAALIGRPDEIAAKIEKLKGMGVEYLLLNGGGSRENLRRFAREVIPSFAKQSVAAE